MLKREQEAVEEGGAVKVRNGCRSAAFNCIGGRNAREGGVRTCSVEEGGPADNTNLGAVAPGGAVGARTWGGVLYWEVAHGPA
jgi:hypothetical protein